MGGWQLKIKDVKTMDLTNETIENTETYKKLITEYQTYYNNRGHMNYPMMLDFMSDMSKIDNIFAEDPSAFNYFVDKVIAPIDFGGVPTWRTEQQ